MNVLRVAINNCRSSNVVIAQVRCLQYLSHQDGDSLWKSLQADSGKVGGRGKRTKKRPKVDLGRNKVLGEGKLGYKWPGLNVKSGEEISKRTEEEQQHYEAEQEEMLLLRKRKKSAPDSSERGWSGGLWGGQRVICSDTGEDSEISKQFDAYILEARRVSHMHGRIGRVYSFRAMVAVGNGNGTFGIGFKSAGNVVAAARSARIKALKRLNYVERFENRTVYEDMYVNHHRTFMSIRQQPEGYGLRSHRAIMTLCKLIGIKDLHVKTTGSTTMLSIMKCFIKALHAQETYQQQADRLGYHVVQCDSLRENYPVVLASPSGEVKKEPFDEYDAYMNRPLITKQIRELEHDTGNPFSKVFYSASQGPPIPAPDDIPEVITKIKDATI